MFVKLLLFQELSRQWVCCFESDSAPGMLLLNLSSAHTWKLPSCQIVVGVFCLRCKQTWKGVQCEFTNDLTDPKKKILSEENKLSC